MRYKDLSPLRQRLLLLTITLLLVAILVLLAEGAVRVRHYLRAGSMWGVEKTYTIDPESGLRVPVPGLVAGAIRINSMGFRGPEIELPKPANRIRIAYLGGSTTYCAEVSSNAATWPALVDEQLKAAFPGADFDYVNGGIPGYTSKSSLKNLRLRVAKLEPDVVVVYHGTNDLSQHSYDLAREQGLVSARTGQKSFWLSKYSMLSFLVEKNLQVMLRQSEASKPVGKLVVERETIAAPFARDLDALLSEASKLSSLAVIATFSHRIRREQSEDERKAAAVTSLYYMPYMTLDGLLEGFEAYNDAIVDAAERHDTVLIQGADDIPGDEVHFVDSVHFTDAGSQVMANRVVRSLRASKRFSAIVASRSGSSSGQQQ